MFRSLAVSWLLVATITPMASAQQWARKMFKVTSHDFGVLARGSKAEFDFEFQNIFEEDVHIAGVRSSCRCTETQITNQSLKTWEKGAIRAIYNTRAFLGSNSSTLTVIIDRPYYAEVQLSVRGYVRGDVMFTPGSVSLGEVEAGQGAERRIDVSYAGRAGWEILDVRSANPHFEVELSAPRRIAGRVNYEMIVRLKGDAPPGYLQDQLTVVTNDSRNRSLELSVEGRVVSPLTVSPASLFLGVLQPGETVEKRLFVRGTKPFRILSIESTAGNFQFQVTDQSTTSHLIPVTFTAGSEAGKVSETIEIKTDLGAATTCIASATITDGTSTDSEAGAAAVE